MFFPASRVPSTLMKKNPSPKDVVRAIDPRLCEPDLGLVELTKDREGFIKSMIQSEERSKMKGFKFGVLYCKEGQTKEEEMFGNGNDSFSSFCLLFPLFSCAHLRILVEHGSPAFERFMETIGERVALKDWKKFRAGLDVNNNATGTHSFFAGMDSHEIMFHVSTLLPFRKVDLQQLERKRHIGNDICMLVYREGKNLPRWRPNTVESEFIREFRAFPFLPPLSEPSLLTSFFACALLAG